MSEKEYLIMFDFDVRKRHYHKTKSGEIVAFTVQLEIRFEELWKEVIRYDCTHAYAHKDCYNIKGKHKKISLFIDYDEALNIADDDINENWGYYKERFLKGEMPC